MSAGYLAAQHLLERGHRHLGLVRLDTISIGQRAVEMLLTGYKGQPLSEELCQPLMPQLIPRGST